MAGKQQSKKTGTAKRGTSSKQKSSTAVKSNGGKAVKKRSGKKILAIVLAVLLVLAIIGGVAVGLYFLLRKDAEVQLFSVTYRDEEYQASGAGFTLLSGEEFTVMTSAEETKYSVKILASSAKEDFSLLVGEKQARWSDYSGKDFTDGFEIKTTESGFTVSYDGIQEIISGAVKKEVELLDYHGGLIFTLVITMGKTELRLNFGLGERASGLLPDPDGIVF